MSRFIRNTIALVAAATLTACQGTRALDLTLGAEGAGTGSGAGAPREAGGQAGTRLAVNSDARVRFAPVIGATEEALTPLSSRLSARARQRGLSLVSGEGDATLVVKGYFSTIADGGRTTVIYVWDVLDPSGTRLHRIQGQQPAIGGRGTGWSSVTDETMQAIADRTIDELTNWLSRSVG